MLALVLTLSLAGTLADPGGGAPEPTRTDHTARLLGEELALGGVGFGSLIFFDLEAKHLCAPGDGGCGFELYIFQAGTSALVGPLLAYGMHRLGHGYGDYRMVFGGYLAGVVAWPLAWFLAGLLTGHDLLSEFAITSAIGLVGYAIPGIVTGTLAGGFILESDSDEHEPAPALVALPMVGPHAAGVRLAIAF